MRLLTGYQGVKKKFIKRMKAKLLPLLQKDEVKEIIITSLKFMIAEKRIKQINILTPLQWNIKPLVGRPPATQEAHWIKFMQQIVMLHRGTIQVHSMNGKGTVFLYNFNNNDRRSDWVQNLLYTWCELK